MRWKVSQRAVELAALSGTWGSVSGIRLLRLRGLFRNRGRLLSGILFFIVAVGRFPNDAYKISEAHLLRGNNSDFASGRDG